MFFQPAIGTGGYTGWRILESTEARQREVFEKSPVLARDIDYFRENIANATSAEDLVKDRRLLTVALGAFGLGDEINKQAFVQKILEEGTADEDSFANRLNDERFKEMTEAFGYGDGTGALNVTDPLFVEDVVARYKTLEFERAVGETDNDMRLAMNFRREIAKIANEDVTDTTAWFRIMGQQPLREVLATAFNIPDAVSQLDIDRQQEIFADKANQLLGDSSPKVFEDPDVVNDMIRRFFLSRQLENGPSPTTPGFAALTLLQNSSLGGQATANLLLSQI